MKKEYKTLEQKRKFYNSTPWKHMRKFVQQRDNGECQECKRQGKVFIDTYEKNKSGKRKKIKLIVHHIKELEFYPELDLDPSNLELICVNCHNKEHDRYYGYGEFKSKWKKNKYSDDEKW